MNTMTDRWVTFGIDEGQIVKQSFRYDADSDRVIRRRYDQSDQTTEYAAASCPEDLEWNGSESDSEAQGLTFRDIPSNPFGEE